MLMWHHPLIQQAELPGVTNAAIAICFQHVLLSRVPDALESCTPTLIALDGADLVVGTLSRVPYLRAALTSAVLVDKSPPTALSAV